MPERRAAAELVCRGLLLSYLCWLPLPFGSVTERAQLPLVAGALVICAMAAAARGVIPSRPSDSLRSLEAGSDAEQSGAGGGSLAALGMTRAFRLWVLSALLLIAVAALQLVPLPDALLGALSPESLRTWSDA